MKHVREQELTRRNRTRRPANFRLGDLVLVHHSPFPPWPRTCLQDPYLGSYRIIKMNGPRIHLKCSLRLGGELLCAPKQLRHYHLPDELFWEEWRSSDREVQRIDLDNAANPEEAHELEEMTAEEMAVGGYYVVAGIARHKYKQGWKFLALSDGYWLSEATWEPRSAFIQPDGSISPIFRSYLVENNEAQLLTRAKTLSQRKKKGGSPCAYLFIVPNQTEEVASFRRRWYTPDTPSSRWRPPSGHPTGVLAPPGGTLSPLRGRSNTEVRRNTTSPLILFAAQRSVPPIAPASHHTFSTQFGTKNGAHALE